MTRRIVLVDNDVEMVRMLERHFQSEGWSTVAVSTGADALAAVQREDVDVVLSDLVMDGVDGLTVLRAAQQREPSPRVILMTAFGSMESAIEAIRHGAYDYLTKPFRLDAATVAVNRALDDRRLREENRRLKAEIAERFGLDTMLGRSPAMLALFEKIRAVAKTDATVLLVGESGTGKELVARAIHHASARRDAPLVAVNCAAIPESLLESELFGHEKGAFTGADRKRRGLLVEAHGGTLFLDEIGDIPLALQAKLLRVLQDRSVRPVGGDREVPLDVRVMCATHRGLHTLVAGGKFREDLYYRLAVIPLRLPSLRERPDDVVLLAEHFLARAAAALDKKVEGFDKDAAAWLLRHRWPGNVRELENVVERAVTLAHGALVGLSDLHVEFSADGPARGGSRPTLAELERQYVERVLEETKGDKRSAARILGVSVRTLQRKFK